MDKTLKDEITQEIAQLEAVYNIIIDFFVNYSFQLLGAVLVLIIGLMMAKRVAKVIQRLCESKGIDITLSRFIANMVKIIIVFMVALVCLGKIGISVTPFLAAIGALSLGAGLALQGLLSNYAAGLNIILTRPFVVGDTIQVQCVSGLVKDILLAYTIIVTEDDVTITIPNKHIVGKILHNSNHVSLIELSVGVAYDSDIEKVTNILTEAVIKHPDTSQFKKPLVGITDFGDSSVNIELRVWVDSIKLNAARFSLNKMIWDVLKGANISIPFPQREVQLIKTEK